MLGIHYCSASYSSFIQHLIMMAFKYFILLTLAISSTIGQESNKNKKIELQVVPPSGEGEKEERLGLLASTLGIQPVPGYKPEQESFKGQALVSPPVKPEGKYETEAIPVIVGGGGEGGYDNGGGFQGG